MTDDSIGESLPTWSRQSTWRVRFGWGPVELRAVIAEQVVIVDVFRFTTAVDAAVAQGASVFPYRWKDQAAANFAASRNAILADGADPAGPSLSPVRLSTLQRGDRVVLPSPNGSTCAAIAGELGATSVVAACLRNAQAVARWLTGEGGSVAVVACGERWPDGSLRPALEDLLGAGAVISALDGSRSPEAEAAAVLWESVAADVVRLLRATASGQELAARGWSEDLMFACEVGASSCVPLLRDGAFTNAADPHR